MKLYCFLLLIILSDLICAQNHQLGTSVSMISLHSKLPDNSGATLSNNVNPYFTAAVDYCYFDDKIGLNIGVFKGIALYSVEYKFTDHMVFSSGPDGVRGHKDHYIFDLKTNILTKGVTIGLNYQIFKSVNSRHKLFFSELLRLEFARNFKMTDDDSFIQLVDYEYDSTMTLVSYDSSALIWSGSSYLDVDDKMSLFLCPGISYQFKLSEKLSLNANTSLILRLGENLGMIKQCCITPFVQVGFGCRYHFPAKKED